MSCTKIAACAFYGEDIAVADGSNSGGHVMEVSA